MHGRFAGLLLWLAGIGLGAAVFLFPWTQDGHVRQMTSVAWAFLATRLASGRILWSLAAAGLFAVWPVRRLVGEWVSLDNPHAQGEAYGILAAETFIVLAASAAVSWVMARIARRPPLSEPGSSRGPGPRAGP